MLLLHCADPGLHKQRASVFPTPVMLSHVTAVPFVITSAGDVDKVQI